MAAARAAEVDADGFESACDDTPMMYAAVTANFVTQSGNTVAQVVVPSGSSR